MKFHSKIVKKQRNFFFIIVAWGLMEVVFLRYGHAEDATTDVQQKNGKKEKVNVLDFEGEMIEGERKKPDLILQIAPQDLSFDSLLYNRTDFNDFLEVDKNIRPRFIIKVKK
jgi:hypothetical protein